MSERFQDGDVREILLRAEEIHQQEQLPIELGPETEEIAKAAQEAGLSRSSVTQALRERVAIQSAPLKPGDLVFADAGENRLYAAEVLEIGKGHARLRFLGGADASVSLADLMPFQMLPGQKVRCPWPNWGWWTCAVVSYDREARYVRASDNWGSEHTSQVYVERVRTVGSVLAPVRSRLAGIALGVGLFAGSALGAAITWLLLR